MNTTESRREFEEQAEKAGYTLSNMPSKLMIDFAFDMWQAARERQKKIHCTCGNPSQHVTGWHSNLCWDCRQPIKGINPPASEKPAPAGLNDLEQLRQSASEKI